MRPRVIRPGSSYWYRMAREKGLECRSLIESGASLPNVWWAAFVAVHHANKVLAIHNRMMRIPNRIAKSHCQCRVIVYDGLASLPTIPPLPFTVIPEYITKTRSVL